MFSTDDAREYLAKIGKRGLKTLATIESLHPFVEMMETDLGKQFLKDDIEQHSELINKIYESLISTGVAEQRDVIELKLRHDRLKKIYDRLKTYFVSSQMVKKIANE
jgi:hypothetical protein